MPLDYWTNSIPGQSILSWRNLNELGCSPTLAPSSVIQSTIYFNIAYIHPHTLSSLGHRITVCLVFPLTGALAGFSFS
jgi:hypothetical protein